ncbi:hypothetical protein PTRA_a1903 [Pseudoalteromonas translucida KMM 520]|uniref:Tyr recombinase domain-containing protein n=1 Tax=Pseudoalteromonas translucida KMM 520 TaxID=1315283 RepID=A0A0U2LMZ9_9GAMM|nr:site-specific integrase [Pseudoalteromonas translucida]ALS33046.1 hypothetical protein PTRA_a1903 [Pseudoalteromonas translucida KMM 520]
MTNVSHRMSVGPLPPLLHDEQKAFIKLLNIPLIMKIPSNSKFDQKFVHTTGERWEFKRLGVKHVYIFNIGCIYLNKLLKYVTIKYAYEHSAPLTDTLFHCVRRFLSSSELNDNASLNNLEKEAMCNNADVQAHYVVKSVIRSLFRIGFPGFEINHYQKLNFLKTPAQVNNFLKYEDIENIMPSHLKYLIVRRLAEFSTKEGLVSLSNNELKCLVILGLCYSTGMRSSQFSMLHGSSVLMVSHNKSSGLARYEILMPIAKQQKITGDLSRVAIPYEVGRLVDEYKTRNAIGEGDQLFVSVTSDLSPELHRLLNEALKFIQSDEFKADLAKNKVFPPRITIYDFRHNIGHSMAMRGASAEEIAHILGHTSIVAAKHYISATPELALLKHKALGSNPIWLKMIGLMMSGYSVEENDWSGKVVNGVLGSKLVLKVGGCERKQEQCHLSKVRSCYGCFYFRPFTDLEKHKEVLNIITNELINQIEVSQISGNHVNPLIDTVTCTKHEVQMVINRISGGLL